MVVKALIVACLVGLAVTFSSCQGSSGTPVVDKADLENQVRQTVADKVGQDIETIPKVYCPGNLTGKKGIRMSCTMAADSSGNRYQLNLQVTKVSGKKVDFDLTSQPLKEQP